MRVLRILPTACLAALASVTPAQADSQRLPGVFDPGGGVNSIDSAGPRTFVGGTFGVVAVDSETGQRDESFRIDVDGRVDALGVAGDKLIIGGYFSSVNGTARRNLASVDVETASVDPNFAPNPNSTVQALVVSGSRVYIGGRFLRVGGVERSRLAALYISSGRVIRPFSGVARGFRYSQRGRCRTASFGSQVQSLAISGTRLYVGGDFSDVGGIERANLVAINTVSGAVDRRFRRGQINCTASVFALQATPPRLYVGGLIARVDGASVSRLAAVSSSTGTLYRGFRPSVPNSVRAIARRSNRLFVGSASQPPLRVYTLVTGTAVETLEAAGGINAVETTPTRVFVGLTLAPHLVAFGSG